MYIYVIYTEGMHDLRVSLSEKRETFVERRVKVILPPLNHGHYPSDAHSNFKANASAMKFQ